MREKTTRKTSLDEYIGAICLMTMLFVGIVILCMGLRVSTILQCNNWEYKELLRLEKIALSHGNYLPLRNRFGDWKRNHKVLPTKYPHTK